MTEAVMVHTLIAGVLGALMGHAAYEEEGMLFVFLLGFFFLNLFVALAYGNIGFV